MDEFAPAYQDWRVLFAGDGPEHGRLLEFVTSRPGWADRVLFLGRRTDVPELLNAMDVYVLPSVSEGICNSLLEAMAAGLPVIATATGGNPEVAVDGNSGLLFPVGDARLLAQRLLALRAQSDFRAQLGRQALHRVQQEFSIEAMVRSYAEMYETVAGDGR
jgi:glycosyltransferase involved in cell wall biosynthesis